MKLFVGITDYDWFRYLQSMQPEELNFWQPGGMRLFKTLRPGAHILARAAVTLPASHARSRRTETGYHPESRRSWDDKSRRPRGQRAPALRPVRIMQL